MMYLTGIQEANREGCDDSFLTKRIFHYTSYANIVTFFSLFSLFEKLVPLKGVYYFLLTTLFLKCKPVLPLFA
jgi:hypothetical protein